MNETWDSRAAPIMRALGEREGIGTGFGIRDLAASLGLDPDAVAIELRRLLDAGYVSATIAQPMGPLANGTVMSPRLSERGARAVGMWPSDDPYEALVALIETQLAKEGDTETKTKLRKLREVLGDVGKGTASGLLVALIQASGHIP
jgi:DNA-binding transcriptional ArsR family regulator